MEEQSDEHSEFSQESSPRTPTKKVRLDNVIHQRVIADGKVGGDFLNNGTVKVSDLTLIDPKMMNKRSPILLDYSHFMIPDPETHPMLKSFTICMVPGCSKPAIKTLNGMTGLGQHLSRRHGIHINTSRMIKRKKDDMSGKEGGTNVLRQLNPVPKLTSQQRRENILDGIVNLVIDNNLPLSLCESPTFRRLCRSIAGTQTSPSFARQSVREALKVKAGLAREATTWALCSIDEISLTMDHWTSCAGDTYSGTYIRLLYYITLKVVAYAFAVYTAHYLGEKGLTRLLLHLDKFSGSTSSEDLSTEFQDDILMKYNIQPDKVVAFVTDTTSNMGKFGKFLRERFSVEHLYCVDHQIHLTAILARKDSNIPGGNGTMKCFRELMQFFNSSTQALEKLLTSMESAGLKPVKPIQDNVTRWWSTYSSMSRYLDDGVSDHITLLLSNAQLGGSCTDLSQTHKMVLKDVMVLLHPLSQVQKMLEGEKYATISLVAYCITYIRKCLHKATQPNKLFNPVRLLGIEMKKDFNKRYGDGLVNYYNPVNIGRNNRYISLHPYHVFASFLDPRINHCDCVRNTEVEQVWLDIKTFSMELQPHNNNNNNNNTVIEDGNDNEMLRNEVVIKPNLRAAMEFYQDSENDSSDDEEFNGGGLLNMNANKCDEEIVSFRAIEKPKIPKFNINHLKKEEQFDVVRWWESKKYVLPILYRSWKRLIIITATSAPSEREWSKLNNVLTKNRNKLDPSFVSDLMMIKENAQLMSEYMNSLGHNNN